MAENTILTALLFGAISTVSMPIGSALGIVWNPRKIIVAALIAFGGGALLAALTLDLFGEALESDSYFTVAIGALIGSVIFIVLNDIVNNKGGFLRKAGTTMTYMQNAKSKQIKAIIQKLSKIPLFQKLPAEEMQAIYPHLKVETFKKGTKLVKQGEKGGSMFIIEKGEIDIMDDKKKKKIATLGAGDVLGEIALVTGEPRTASAVAKGIVRVWSLKKKDFEAMLHSSPTMAKAIEKIVSSRLDQLKAQKSIDSKKAQDWAKKATENIDEKIAMPTMDEVKEAAKAHAGAPVAIWLGSLLDGIPSSFVIGASLVGGGTVSFSIVGAFFLANFPEALSSAIGMKQQGFKKLKIFGMWTSQMVIISIGAALGFLLLSDVSHTTLIFVDGIAAGAMMTVIAETMLPEAYHQGGAVTGISTLLGFLAAIFFTTLQ